MSNKHYYEEISSPLGALLVVSNGEALTGIYMEAHKGGPVPTAAYVRDAGAVRPAREQLEAYFAGERTVFDLQLSPTGTEFSRQVWEELRRIPFGETISYSELARRLGNPAAVRAVGTANGRNPLSIVVPCHRVIGKGGSLTGYAGGLSKKKWLLEHEARVGRGA